MRSDSLESPYRPIALDIGAEEKARMDEGSTWRPDWLRPFVLAIFSGLFSGATVALFIMLCYSHKNDGLFRTESKFTFVWRFGPTAVFAIVAGLWARVELQSQRYMPWIVLCKRQSTSDVDYTLDYTSMMSPTLIYQSLRRKHFLVFLTTLVSLLLKIQIVLVPSLYQLGKAGVSQSTPVRILDTFKASDEESETANRASSTLALNNSSAYYVARAIHDFNSTYPFGVTEDAAFQLFEPRGSTDAQITVLVDGFFTDMHCLKLESFKVLPPTSSFNLTLNFEGCHDIPHRIQEKNEETAWEIGPPLNRGRACRNIPQQNPQYIFSAVTMRGTSENPSPAEIVAFAAVLCSPTAWTSKVEVVDDGIISSLSLPAKESRTPHNVDVWAMIERSLPIKLGSTASTGLTDYSFNHGYFKYGPAGVWAQFQSKSKAANDQSVLLNTTEVLYESMIGLVRKFGPLAGHYSLRRDENAEAMGHKQTQVDKLKIRYRIGYPMTSLFALITSISIFILIRYREETTIWNRNPATVLGNMLFFHNRGQLVDHKSYFEQKHTEAWRGQSRFVPAILRIWVQTAFTFAILVIIAILLHTMKLSEAKNGLPATEGDNHLLWTSLPTLIMLGVSLYTASFNASLRGLFTLYSLSEGPCHPHQLETTLLDMLGLRALFIAVRRKAWPVSLSQVLASLCAILTTIASTLFTVESVPKRVEFQLRQESWFGERPSETNAQYYWNNRALVGSMALLKGANLTYPENTFRDLAFPVIGDLPPSVVGVSEGTPVEVTLPGATLVARCESQALSTSNPAENDPAWLYTVQIPVTCSDGTSDIMNTSVARPNTPSQSSKDYYLAYSEILGFEGSNNNSPVCGLEASHNHSVLDSAPSVSKVYFWGNWDFERHDLGSFQAWQCRYSWEKVMVSVDMVIINGKLMINHNNPPRPDRSTLEPWTPPISVPYLDPQADGIGAEELGNAFPEVTQSLESKSWFNAFNILVPPYGQVPLEAFRDANQRWKILEALNSNRALLSAQIINIENRLSVKEMSPQGLEPLSAVLIDNDVRRLVQNPTSTYLLVGILGIVGIVHLFMLFSSVLRRFTGWRKGLLDMDVRGLAPDGFSSIAMMAALLDGSNFSTHSPKTSQNRLREEASDMLSPFRFRMGWFRRESDQVRHFTIGVVDDDDFSFLGSKEDWEKWEASEGEEGPDNECIATSTFTD
ncbi:hypothetical protein CORC01_12558 [Colletotrichum orchidophilum]|uniref:Uncharacterized protein n=1 Tax=Colletotrichum orchidophilum TaxID=1209926 RepID=A0A1G4ASR0_9PEZI|nr:uncharacterized protein CORC01_12558 [Colletotrichum orchidophilum]OHE92155.1 hypothetical protein CORC01_12558 [Colletotrichum orchidophilum]